MTKGIDDSADQYLSINAYVYTNVHILSYLFCEHVFS